jgi:4-hydroxybenzoate polyprenyltransferase
MHPRDSGSAPSPPAAAIVAAARRRSGLLGRVGVVLEMIKFQHTIFALPFALIGALLAAWREPEGLGRLAGWPIVWIVLACVFARSAAMAFNRLADQWHDAHNPRTRDRALPAGQLTRRFVGIFVIVNCLGFVAMAGLLNPTALAFSPFVLAVLLGYSYTKRVTILCHWFLGLALGLAPAGAWVAISGTIAWPAIALGLAVMFWTAGFDLIYACQDVEFDTTQRGLHSMPKAVGVSRALGASRAAHLVAWLLFATVLWAEPLGWGWGAGLVAAAFLLIRQHSIISADDLSRVNAAFFTSNGLLSIAMFVATLVDVLAARAG